MELSDFQMKLVGWRELSGKEKLYILPDIVYRVSSEKGNTASVAIFGSFALMVILVNIVKYIIYSKSIGGLDLMSYIIICALSIVSALLVYVIDRNYSLEVKFKKELNTIEKHVHIIDIEAEKVFSSDEIGNIVRVHDLHGNTLLGATVSSDVPEGRSLFVVCSICGIEYERVYKCVD